MASFRNSRIIPLVAALGMIAGVATGCERAKPAAAEKTPGTPAAETAAPAAPPVAAAKDKERLDLPVPKGQPQKGLRIPIYSPDGKLMYRFAIGMAEVIDEDHIKFGEAHVEWFKASGELDYDIDLSDSIYNQKTADLVSNVHVTIKHKQFALSGENVTLNVKTQTGKLGGGVKMIIYDAQAAIGEDEKNPSLPSIEVKPAQEEKK